MMQRRHKAVQPAVMLHSEAVSYFNRLIIDLKLELLGQEHDPITMERLDEAREHIRDIEQCEEPTRFYYH